MDYEKKYKLSLDRIKVLIANVESGSKDCISIDDIKEIYPELAESEDERIRKELIQNLKERFGTKGTMGGNLDMPKVIAWLEKQGEQKPKKCMYSNDNYTDEERKVLCDGCKEECDLRQKSEWSEEEKKKLDRIYSILGIAADEHAYSSTCRLIGDKEAIELQDFLRSIAKTQQKTEWCEEDERVRYNVIAFLGFAAGQRGVKNREYKEAIDWVKSLPIGFITNPNYNENMIELLINELQQIENENNAPNQYKKEIEWLKSLRPKNTWKPSDRELGAILVAIGDERQKGSDVAKELLKIYQDLKKLKEE